MRADAFARHLLLLQKGIIAFLGDHERVDGSTLSEIVQHFRVSPAIAAIGLHDAGYIDPNITPGWMRLPTRMLDTRFGWSDYYETLQADSDRLRAPQGLVARAIAGYAEGVVDTQVIATLRGIPVALAVAEFDEAGIFPRSPEEAEFEIDELPVLEIDLSEIDEVSERP